jgi:Domain of unknown function (DUF4145)
MVLAKVRGVTDGRSWVAKGKPEEVWPLLPFSRAKVLPDYIPRAIAKDYVEACAVETTSTKASATLSRRCIQAIIRDFYKIRKLRLIDEIDELEGQVDGAMLEALHALRKIGNIGAHPDRDPGVVVEVEDGEAAAMIDLVELVLEETYVASKARQSRLDRAKAIGESRSGGDPGC